MLFLHCRLALLFSLLLTPLPSTSQEVATGMPSVQGLDVTFEEFEIPSDDATISNGLRAPTGAFPGAVRLLLGDATCSGTLVSARLVLTAAHCFFRADGSKRAEVTVEFNKLRSGPFRYRDRNIPVAGNVVIAPGYAVNPRADGVYDDFNNAEGDLAIIRLPDDAPDADRRVTQLAQPQELRSDWRVYVTGFGHIRKQSGTRISLASSRDLMYLIARLKTRDDPGELKSHRDSYADRAFVLYQEIAVHANGQRRIEAVVICFGDSGGGTFLVPQNTTLFGDASILRLVGVNSRISEGNLEPGQPGFQEPSDLFGEPTSVLAEQCTRRGNGSTVTSVPANLEMIRAMATSLGENL